jgi:hypothetical protein
MFVRCITAAEVRAVIDEGETIERYPNDVPYPSRCCSASWVGARCTWWSPTMRTMPRRSW